jgi:hypothetical protein
MYEGRKPKLEKWNIALFNSIQFIGFSGSSSDKHTIFVCTPNKIDLVHAAVVILKIGARFRLGVSWIASLRQRDALHWKLD